MPKECQRKRTTNVTRLSKIKCYISSAGRGGIMDKKKFDVQILIITKN